MGCLSERAYRLKRSKRFRRCLAVLELHKPCYHQPAMLDLLTSLKDRLEGATGRIAGLQERL
jgi:hypothetical protein